MDFFLFQFKYIFKCNLQSWISASLLQSSVSRDPSEIILICWFGALIIIHAICQKSHFEQILEIHVNKKKKTSIVTCQILEI